MQSNNASDAASIPTSNVGWLTRSVTSLGDGLITVTLPVVNGEHPGSTMRQDTSAIARSHFKAHHTPFYPDIETPRKTQQGLDCHKSRRDSNTRRATTKGPSPIDEGPARDRRSAARRPCPIWGVGPWLCVAGFRRVSLYLLAEYTSPGINASFWEIRMNGIRAKALT